MNVLPTEEAVVAEKLATRLEQLTLTTAEYRWAVCVIEKLINKSASTANGWVALNGDYIYKAFGSTGQKILTKLCKACIVDQTNSYSTGKNAPPYPKSYRVAADLFNYNRDSLVKESTLRDKTQRSIPEVVHNLKQLELSYEDAVSEAHQIISKISIDDYLVNDEIEDKAVELYDITTNRTFYIKLDAAKAYAAKYGRHLIQKKPKGSKVSKVHVVDSPVEFVASKKANLKLIWTRALTRIEKRVFRARRNDTNNRLDTDLTNLPGQFMKYMTVDSEELVSIDLKNSQFSILAGMLSKPEAFGDERALFFKQFTYDEHTLKAIEIMRQGLFYEHLCELLDMDVKTGRSIAKTAAFACIFSSHRAKTKDKAILRRAFTQLVKMTDAFKKEYGDNQLAIMLQKIESEAFIDGIAQELYNKHIWHATKHDSVICKKSDVALVEGIVKTTLEKYHIKGIIETELLNK
ncbi:hypothetical protein FVR03_21685 [Pontibacter qinzhouensis]|uniref:Uncharacterized protein n=1 Tax=Pontibacter qinzhouensis TaxID=2603253 RepID=A0A5C8IZ70_9BACT|nr:hypothetical protein [Pontibacter qinzhouensis]TXK26537.1 hypothetical protein FVR03_21685 [Pontibacter qinzhouensis]